jgi:hypothetical protein
MQKFPTAGGLVAALAVTGSLLVTTATATASAGAGVLAVADADADQAREPDAIIMLSVRTIGPRTVGDTAGNPRPRRLVTCGPDGGEHPDAVAACTSLRAVDGEFADLPAVADVLCTMQHAPVEVSATGRWNGTPVHYAETFSNRCVAEVETDNVFRY